MDVRKCHLCRVHKTSMRLLHDCNKTTQMAVCDSDMKKQELSTDHRKYKLAVSRQAEAKPRISRSASLGRGWGGAILPFPSIRVCGHIPRNIFEIQR